MQSNTCLRLVDDMQGINALTLVKFYSDLGDYFLEHKISFSDKFTHSEIIELIGKERILSFVHNFEIKESARLEIFTYLAKLAMLFLDRTKLSKAYEKDYNFFKMAKENLTMDCEYQAAYQYSNDIYINNKHENAEHWLINALRCSLCSLHPSVDCQAHSIATFAEIISFRVDVKPVFLIYINDDLKKLHEGKMFEDVMIYDDVLDILKKHYKISWR